MRTSVLRNLSSVRFSLVLLLALLASLAVAGCGGGGGSSSSGTGGTTGGGTTGGTTGGTGSATLAILTGKVTSADASATPIANATITIAGTSLSTKTAANGTFSFINVPVGTVGVVVQSPSTASYYNIVQYGPAGAQTIYNGGCAVPVTTTASGINHTATAVPYPLQLFAAGTTPPPPPSGSTDANGCPK